MSVKFSKKLTIAAGSISAIAIPTMADAALVTKTTPITFDLFDLLPGPGTGNVHWDVDGDGTNEVIIGGGATGEGSFNNGFITNGYLGIAEGTGDGFIFFANLPATDVSFASSVTITNANLANYGTVPLSATMPLVNNVMGTRTTTGTAINQASTANNLSLFPFGTFNIAFVVGGADVHIGWASLTFTPTSLTVNEWTYETLPAGTPSEFSVHVGERAPVPEPASTLPAIALLAAGAAGVRSWRKRKTG